MGKKMMEEKEAHALCTIIVIGYAKDILKDERKKAVFQYESDSDKSKHNKVKDRLEPYVEIDVSQSVTKEKFPLIVAKTDRVSSFDYAGLVAGTETKLSGELERKLKELELGGLYGAYIGGYSSTSRIELVGASDLDLYTPKYRISSSEVKEAYNSAKKTSNKVIDLLTEYQSSISGGKNVDGVKISVQDLNPKITADFSEKKVFKSFHGMIVAMTKYASSSDQNSFIFEIACSDKTSKISSCFPCATFMKSQGKPATSVHLGRGDNWNIPTSLSSSSMKNNWEENIKKWYELGEIALKDEKWNSFIKSYDSKSTDSRLLDTPIIQEIGKRVVSSSVLALIPEMFLEALTFEKSFADRILETIPASE